MANRKSTEDQSKPKGPKPSRTNDAAPMPPTAAAPSGSREDGPFEGGVRAYEKRSKVSSDAPKKRDGADSDAGEPLKKQELIEMVVARSDVTRKFAKPVIEAMLAVLGEALAEGRDLNLQPLGKVKRKRVKDAAKARIIVANIRQPHGAGAQAAQGAPAGQDNAMKPGSTPGSGSAALGGEGPSNPAAPLRHPLKEAVADDGEGR